MILAARAAGACLALLLAAAPAFAAPRSRAPGAKLPGIPALPTGGSPSSQPALGNPLPAGASAATFARTPFDATSIGALLRPAGAAVRGRRAESLRPDDTGPYQGKPGKKRALKELAGELERIQELQRRLYAEKKTGVLIVLQAMDTAGKDGTIRHVLGSMDPQGVQVRSFKAPTEEELAHDFLWRLHPWVPRKGTVGVFNRSHYEDILVPTVEKLLPKDTIDARYRAINEWERTLAESGVVVLKFFLDISKAEQKTRLDERLANPDKRWKFDPNDLKAREKWDKFMRVYRRILRETDTRWAPWIAVPADKKWYRNLVIARTLRRALEAVDPRYPPAKDGLDGTTVPR